MDNNWLTNNTKHPLSPIVYLYVMYLYLFLLLFTWLRHKLPASVQMQSFTGFLVAAGLLQVSCLARDWGKQSLNDYIDHAGFLVEGLFNCTHGNHCCPVANCKQFVGSISNQKSLYLITKELQGSCAPYGRSRVISSLRKLLQRRWPGTARTLYGALWTSSPSEEEDTGIKCKSKSCRWPHF